MDAEPQCRAGVQAVGSFFPHCPSLRALAALHTHATRNQDTTPLTMVRSLEDLRQLCRALEGQREVAVDLEHHRYGSPPALPPWPRAVPALTQRARRATLCSYRSFLGLLCLMQLSTREQDYIVDVLALRGHMHLLNDCFANPAVVKVLHGADRDILWLQRDCGLYIVNMFDTGQAARVLQYSSYSLAHLLQHHCRVTANKQLQRADWRLRPLPADMVKYVVLPACLMRLLTAKHVVVMATRRYAREDTHYLLYIYDQMKNQLLDEAGGETHLLDTVLVSSRMWGGGVPAHVQGLMAFVSPGTQPRVVRAAL